MDENFCIVCDFNELCDMEEELPELCPCREGSPISAATEKMKDALEELIEIAEEEF